jgi:hypothetical protein
MNLQPNFLVKITIIFPILSVEVSWQLYLTAATITATTNTKSTFQAKTIKTQYSTQNKI